MSKRVKVVKLEQIDYFDPSAQHSQSWHELQPIQPIDPDRISDLCLSIYAAIGGAILCVASLILLFIFLAASY